MLINADFGSSTSRWLSEECLELKTSKTLTRWNILQFVWDFFVFRISSTSFQIIRDALSFRSSINNFFKIFVSRIHDSPTEESPNAVHVEAFVDIPHGPPPIDVNVSQHDEHVVIIATDFTLNHNLDDVERVKNGWDESADDCAREELMCVFVQDAVLTRKKMVNKVIKWEWKTLTFCGSFCASSRSTKKSALLGPFRSKIGTKPR